MVANQLIQPEIRYHRLSEVVLQPGRQHHVWLFDVHYYLTPTDYATL